MGHCVILTEPPTLPEAAVLSHTGPGWPGGTEGLGGPPGWVQTHFLGCGKGTAGEDSACCSLKVNE